MQNKQVKQNDSRVTLKPNLSNVSLAVAIITTGNHITGHLKTKPLGTTETIP